MKKRPDRVSLIFYLTVLLSLLTGCSSVGSAASDMGFASAGGVAGYEISHKKIGGAAIGTAAGYLASRFAQSELKKSDAEAEQRGYDRAMNQAVKQQYWIIQHQQQSRESVPESEPRLQPVVIPETKINGIVQNAHVEYLRVQP